MEQSLSGGKLARNDAFPRDKLRSFLRISLSLSFPPRLRHVPLPSRLFLFLPPSPSLSPSIPHSFVLFSVIGISRVLSHLSTRWRIRCSNKSRYWRGINYYIPEYNLGIIEKIKFINFLPIIIEFDLREVATTPGCYLNLLWEIYRYYSVRLFGKSFLSPVARRQITIQIDDLYYSCFFLRAPSPSL